MRRKIVGAAAAVLACAATPASGQYPPGMQGSSNVKIVSHIPLSGRMRVADVEIEQELSRPYAYVSMRLKPAGFHIINLKDPNKASMLWSWVIENADLHEGAGALGPAYVKTRGRYYFFQTFQFRQGSPDADLGAIVFDVTGLPDTTKIKEVARIHVPEAPGGFHENFAYKHSSGAPLVFTDVSGKPWQNIYDIDKLVAGAPNHGLVGRVP
ncbi:MAG: hypothetical protein HY560_09185, partial [Gemmatimonadetes bacterium]|nr:hypothetical protein [Gemmatimonadota bacterium]